MHKDIIHHNLPISSNFWTYQGIDDKNPVFIGLLMVLGGKYSKNFFDNDGI
jgi:hypothetical protein